MSSSFQTWSSGTIIDRTARLVVILKFSQLSSIWQESASIATVQFMYLVIDHYWLVIYGVNIVPTVSLDFWKLRATNLLKSKSKMWSKIEKQHVSLDIVVLDTSKARNFHPGLEKTNFSYKNKNDFASYSKNWRTHTHFLGQIFCGSKLENIWELGSYHITEVKRISIDQWLGK